MNRAAVAANNGQQSFANCVKGGADYFSLANGLNYLTGGKTEGGVTGGLNQAFLGNTVSDLIGLFQGDTGSVRNVALEKGLPKAGAVAASLVPDVMSTTITVSRVSVQTATVTISLKTINTTTSVLRLGTLARTGTNIFTKGLEGFATAIKLPFDLATASFSGMVCSIGR